MPRLIRLAVRAASALLCFVCLWIVLPAPVYPLLVLAVGAPELSPMLLAVAVMLGVIVLVLGRSQTLDRAALGLTLASVGLSLVPIVQIGGTVARFDATMEAALGLNYACAAPAELRWLMRPNPIELPELFTGLRSPPQTLVTRGITFSSPAGQALRLDLYRTAASGRHPAVIQIYGGAWQRGRPVDDSEFATALAAAGYMVIAIDYRHAPQWQWPSQIDDVHAAMRWLRSHADSIGVNLDQVALIGRSSGAELALLAAYLPDSTRIRAVVSYYGPVDLVEGYRRPPRPDPLDVRSIQTAYLGGTPSQVPDRYLAASPITHVTAGLPPTLLIYGRRDHVVEPRFGLELRDSLLASGNVAALLEIPWAEHAFDAVSGGPGSQIALYEVERFLGWSLGDRGKTSSCPAR